jgi:hypothetical protein
VVRQDLGNWYRLSFLFRILFVDDVAATRNLETNIKTGQPCIRRSRPLSQSVRWDMTITISHCRFRSRLDNGELNAAAC